MCIKVSGSLAALLKQKHGAIYSADPNQTMFESIELMGEKNVGALLVLDHERLIGVVSERDYTRNVALQGHSSHHTRVREILSSPIVNVGPEH